MSAPKPDIFRADASRFDREYLEVRVNAYRWVRYLGRFAAENYRVNFSLELNKNIYRVCLKYLYIGETMWPPRRPEEAFFDNLSRYAGVTLGPRRAPFRTVMPGAPSFAFFAKGGSRIRD